jgi:hypothetical protein
MRKLIIIAGGRDGTAAGRLDRGLFLMWVPLGRPASRWVTWPMPPLTDPDEPIGGNDPNKLSRKPTAAGDPKSLDEPVGGMTPTVSRSQVGRMTATVSKCQLRNLPNWRK